MQVIDLNFLGHTEAIASFLLETTDGLVLIEAGPHSTLPFLEKALAEKGFALADVKHVLLTHIHLDHAGAAWVFADLGATIYVHPFGAKHLANPEKLMESARRIYQDQMDRLWGDMRAINPAQIREVAHEEILTFGQTEIKAWHTPGHAIHHIAWQLGDSLFSGDVAGVRIHGQLPVPPCPPPDINVEHWQASLALIRKLAPKTLYLTHFGAVTDVDWHLNKLEEMLQAWANWMHPYWEQGIDPQTITPLFQAYTKELLLSNHVAEEDLPRYEAANPSWMSVAGLLRYWGKRQ